MKKSKFNLSHNASLTASMGNLIPFCVIDCLPNDSHRLSTDMFVRAQPMMAPLMHVVRNYLQWWFVPYRILWENWTDFITGGLDGSLAPTFPTIKINPETSSLADYFGIPVNGKELEVSALPFRAYAEIWNTRYRDEDLQLEIPVSYADGEDTITNTELQRCSWAKDYFTTARPFTQRGSQISVPVIPSVKQGEAYPVYSPSVILGELQDSVPDGEKIATISIDYLGNYSFSPAVDFSTSLLNGYIEFLTPKTSGGFYKAGTVSTACSTIKSVQYASITITWGQPTSYSDVPVFEAQASFDISSNNKCWDTKPSGINLLGNCSLYSVLNKVNSISFSRVSLSQKVELGSSGAVNIRDLRLSSALQRYQERSMEYGNRYEEFIQREFGIRPRDSRIQRPEYLGGSKSVLQISEVLQTAEGENTGVGTMRGHGVGGLRQRPIRFRAPEHGVIIGILSIRPDSVYTQGLAKQWTKFSKLDYYVPELANIGMQEVFQSELYADGTNSKTLFGYTPRYDEYRKLPNRISGEFRELLNYWNMARSFEIPPVLNSSFITMNPTKRVFAEQTQDSFLIMCRNNIKSYRVVPKRAKNILR